MFSFFKDIKIKEGVVLVYDIGSASVGGALVLLSEKQNPKILYSIRKKMVFQEKLDTKKFAKAMLISLKKVSSDLNKKGIVHLNFLKVKDKKIQESFCFFSSPWVASQTRIVSLQSKEIFTVTKKMVEESIEEEEKTFFEEMPADKKDFKLIDKKVVQLKMNGYVVNSFSKDKVRDAELHLFLSLIDQDILEKVREIIEKDFHLKDIRFCSFTLASFLGLRDVFHFEEDFIFVDVSGEVTDTSFIRDGVIKETQTFPLGKNSFVREALKLLKGTSALVNSTFLSYGKGDLEEKEKNKLEKALSPVKKKWGDYFENSILELSNDSISPKNIFILTDDELNEIIKGIIEAKKFQKIFFPGYDKIVNPVIIDGGKIDDYCFFEKDKNKDVFLGLESIFINRILNEN